MESYVFGKSKYGPAVGVPGSLLLSQTESRWSRDLYSCNCILQVGPNVKGTDDPFAPIKLRYEEGPIFYSL